VATGNDVTALEALGHSGLDLRTEDGRAQSGTAVLMCRKGVFVLGYDGARKPVSLRSIEFPETVGDARWSQRVGQALSSYGKAVGQVTVMIHGADEILMPEGLDDPSGRADLFRLQFHGEPDDAKISAKAADSVTHLIRIPGALAHELERWAPGCKLQGIQNAFVRHCEKAGKGPRIHVMVVGRWVDIYALGADGVSLINRFETTGDDDALYFALSAAKAAGIDPAMADVRVSTFFDDTTELQRTLSRYFRSVRPDARTESVPFPYPFNRVAEDVAVVLWDLHG
jgi:hypothetical protein